MLTTNPQDMMAKNIGNRDRRSEASRDLRGTLLLGKKSPSRVRSVKIELNNPLLGICR